MAEMGGLKVQVAHDKENTSRAAKVGLKSMI